VIPRPPPSRFFPARRGVQPPIRRVPQPQQQALEAHQAIRHIEPGFFPGSFAYPRQTWRLPQPTSYAPPALHPGLLSALANAGRTAALAPYHAIQWVAQQEGARNRQQALEESLFRDRGGIRIAPPTVGHGMGRELGSAAWAYDILHNPWQTRQFIHPRGG